MLTLDSLAGLLRRIDNYSISLFADRLILQKTVYLMQSFGLPLHYRFSWYFHGPYCPALTKQLYEIGEINEESEPRKFKDSNHEDTFSRFIQFLSDRRKDEKWLEAIASLHYLKKNHPNLNNDELINRFLELKPRYTRRVIENYLAYLERYNLT